MAASRLLLTLKQPRWFFTRTKGQITKVKIWEQIPMKYMTNCFADIKFRSQMQILEQLPAMEAPVTSLEIYETDRLQIWIYISLCRGNKAAVLLLGLIWFCTSGDMRHFETSWREPEASVTDPRHYPHFEDHFLSFTLFYWYIAYRRYSFQTDYFVTALCV